jgi:hypothetical protein
MVGPYGDWLRFPYEGTENLYLIPEIDSCRVITDSAVEILQRVPPTATASELEMPTPPSALDELASYSDDVGSDDEKNGELS